MNNKIVFISILFISLLGNCIFAQNSNSIEPCGTTPDMVRSLPAILTNARIGITNIDKCINRELSLNIHIVRDSLGVNGVALSQIQTGVDLLNAHFAPICVSFKICKVNYVDNYKYNYFIMAEELQDFDNQFGQSNVIDVVYVQDLFRTRGGQGAAGVAGDPLMMTKGAAANTTLAHEMGHNFGLLHPFDNMSPTVLADNSNCATTGDNICDTYPEVRTLASDFNACDYKGTHRDANGQFYTPIIGNVMSYQPDLCIAKAPYGFTIGQYNRMIIEYYARWSSYY